jgi:hypothetical protein
MKTLSIIGAAAIAEAIAFNAAFTALALQFDYPDILRRPASEVLARFAEGGPALIATWYSFALTAMALVPLGMALAFAGRGAPQMRTAAAILAALAGTVQAIGLLRWVFAVPALAALSGPQDAAFIILNAWGGVAIGEHLGYVFTAAFLLAMAFADRAEAALYRPVLAVLSALGIVIGALEGLALVLQTSGEVFALFQIAGYAGLSLWLILSGIVHMRAK